MILTEIIEKIKARLALSRSYAQGSTNQSYKQGVEDTLKSIENFLDKEFLEDKGTGAIRKNKLVEVNFRGSKISLPSEYYEVSRGTLSYTTTELDDDFMWRVFKKWCDDRGFSTFREICPEVEGQIRGYVARNKDSQLLFFDNLPFCIRSKGEWDTDCECLPLPKSLFPEITYESGPIRVKLLIEKGV